VIGYRELLVDEAAGDLADVHSHLTFELLHHIEEAVVHVRLVDELDLQKHRASAD
jgi:hypothetical protein